MIEFSWNVTTPVGSPRPDGSFAAVISNSIIHHIPDPAPVFAEMVRLVAPGGILFIRDLARPDTRELLDELVQRYAGQESPAARSLFADSLHAAFTLDEIRAFLDRPASPGGCRRDDFRSSLDHLLESIALTSCLTKAHIHDPELIAFPSLDATPLHAALWAVDEPKGVLFIAHGVGEHGGCYSDVATSIQAAMPDLEILALDFRGHGRSPGRRGFVKVYDDLIGDLLGALRWMGTGGRTSRDFCWGIPTVGKWRCGSGWTTRI